jgi:hypothetical protein
MVSRNQHSSLFLFNILHEDFVRDESTLLPTMITAQRAIRQYLFLMFLIAFPMMIAITLLISLTGHQILLLLALELLTALLTCAYFVSGWYLRDKKLLNKGQIVFGEVMRQEILPGYANIGTSTITRIHYRFVTPENERVINSIDLSSVMHRLPDGRKYPQAGTAIAVLYANEKNHKLL